MVTIFFDLSRVPFSLLSLLCDMNKPVTILLLELNASRESTKSGAISYSMTLIGHRIVLNNLLLEAASDVLKYNFLKFKSNHESHPYNIVFTLSQQGLHNTG